MLLNGLDDPLAVLDAQGRIVCANTTFERLVEPFVEAGLANCFFGQLVSPGSVFASPSDLKRRLQDLRPNQTIRARLRLDNNRGYIEYSLRRLVPLALQTETHPDKNEPQTGGDIGAYFLVKGQLTVEDLRRQPVQLGTTPQLSTEGTESDMMTAYLQTTNILLHTEDIDKALYEALPMVAKPLNADRVSLFERMNTHDTGLEVMSHAYEWCKPGVPPHLDDAILHNIPLDTLPRWYDMLMAGKAIMGRIDEFPPDEQFILRYVEIQSIIILPIIIHKKLWGFVTIDHCQQPYSYTTGLVNLLIQLVQNMGTMMAIKRNTFAVQPPAALATERGTGTIDISHLKDSLVHWEYSFITNKLQMSALFMKDLGYPPELSQTFDDWRKLTPSEEHAQIESYIQGVLQQGGQRFGYQSRMRQADGSLRWTYTSGYVTYAPDGTPTHIRATVQDITQVKMAEETMLVSNQRLEERVQQQTRTLQRAVDRLRKEVEDRKRSEATLRALLNNQYQNIALLAPDRRILALNKTFEETVRNQWNYVLEPGSLFEDAVLEGPSLNSFKDEFQEALAGHVRQNVVFLTCNKRWYEYTLTPVFLEDGRIEGVCFSSIDITERHQWIDALQRSETRFRSLVQNSTDLILQVGQDGSILYASPSVLRITGRTEAESIATNVFSFLHPDDLPQCVEIFSQMLTRPEETFWTECRASHKNGDWLVLEIFGTNWTREAAVESIVLNIRDVTGKRQAEANERRTNDIIRAVFRQSTDALLILDPATLMVLDFNRKAAQLFDATPEARLRLFGLPDLLFADDPTQWPILRNRFGKQQNANWSVEKKLTSLTGRVFWADISLQTTPVGSRQQVIILRIRDTTAQKEAELRLQLLNKAVENAQDAIIITDAALTPGELSIVYVNPAFTRLTGYETEEIIGQKTMFFQSEIADQDVRRYVAEKLATGEPFFLSTFNQTKTGDGHYVEWMISPVRNADGSLANWVAVQRDITERVRLEEKRAIQQRMMTRVIVDAQESERRRIAEDLHDGVGQVISVLKMNFSELESRILAGDQEVKPLLTRTKEILDNAASEIRDISRNLMPAELIDFGLESALRALCTKANGTNHTRVRIHCQGVPRKLPNALEIALYRITQESINNALKYAQAREVNVQLIGDGQTLTLMIEDDGNGFDMERVKAGERGRGLRNLETRARLVGAHFHLDTQPGHGTSIVVEAPMPAADLPPNKGDI